MYPRTYNTCMSYAYWSQRTIEVIKDDDIRVGSFTGEILKFRKVKIKSINISSAAKIKWTECTFKFTTGLILRILDFK